MAVQPDSKTSSYSSLSMTTHTLLASSQLIKQGAEAKVYKGFLYPLPASSASSAPGWGQNRGGVAPSDDREPILLKHRFQKKYRHHTLDSTLTKARVAGEARALMKCLRAGVSVPGIRMVDAPAGVIGIEWIEGQSIRVLLGADDEEADSVEADTDVMGDPQSSLADFGLNENQVMSLIGNEIAKMHLADVVHGDLTTSNMMLRKTLPTDSYPKSPLVLIDFGLSYQSAMVEDKAVDLYVLERAFASTHPNSGPFFQRVIDAYAEKSGKAWDLVSRKLNEVRLRGRKRSMVG